FDVVSIKAHRPGAPQHDPSFVGHTRFTSAGLPLRYVIAFAYGMSVRGHNITSGPAWISSNDAVFDIEAKIVNDSISGSTNANNRQHMLQMVQNLLKDRFQLKTHSATMEKQV